MMACRFCGEASHMDQVTKYPIGTMIKFKLPRGGYGVVRGHCDDGRAIVEISGIPETFHRIDTYVASVERDE